MGKNGQRTNKEFIVLFMYLFLIKNKVVLGHPCSFLALHFYVCLQERRREGKILGRDGIQCCTCFMACSFAVCHPNGYLEGKINSGNSSSDLTVAV